MQPDCHHHYHCCHDADRDHHHHQHRRHHHLTHYDSHHQAGNVLQALFDIELVWKSFVWILYEFSCWYTNLRQVLKHIMQEQCVLKRLALS